MLYAPIIFINFYILLVFLLTSFGPIVYFEFNAVRVLLYLTAVCISMTFGFIIAVRAPLSHGYVQSKDYQDRLNKYFQIFIWMSVIGSILYLIVLFIDQGVNLSLSEIGKTYSDGYKNFEKADGVYELNFILYSALVTPSLFAVVWGMVYIKNLAKREKFLVAWLILIYPAVLTISAGTQKNLGDIFIYVCSTIIIKFAISKKKMVGKVIIRLVAISILVTYLLTNILVSRYESISVNIDNINQSESGLLFYNIDHVIFDIFGYNIGFGIAVLTGYLTNGLNGLSYALTTDTTWSFMLGSSYTMSVIGERYLGTPSGYLHSYPYLAGEISGWGETRWYSVFSWFASDFTFVGTVFLFGFFAYVYGRAWKEAVVAANPFAMVIVSLLNLGIIMMPANNQLMQSPGGMVALIVAFVLYLKFRKPANSAVFSVFTKR